MKRIKTTLITTALVIAMSGLFAPLQIARADDGGTQGASDATRQSNSGSSQVDMKTLILIVSAISSIMH